MLEANKIKFELSYKYLNDEFYIWHYKINVLIIQRKNINRYYTAQYFPFIFKQYEIILQK